MIPTERAKAESYALAKSSCFRVNRPPRRMDEGTRQRRRNKPRFGMFAALIGLGDTFSEGITDANRAAISAVVQVEDGRRVARDQVFGCKRERRWQTTTKSHRRRTRSRTHQANHSDAEQKLTSCQTPTPKE